MVHMSSGYAALVAAFICGPRRKVNLRTPPEGHNIPMFMIGVVFLWFGWFGFNGGSALNASGIAGLAFTNTQIATGTLPELHFTSTHHLHPLFACLPYTILRYHSQTTHYSTVHYTTLHYTTYPTAYTRLIWLNTGTAMTVWAALDYVTKGAITMVKLLSLFYLFKTSVLTNIIIIIIIIY